MSAVSSVSQLYTGTPKLLAVGTDTAGLVDEALYGCFSVRLDADGGIVVTGSDGETTLGAPPTGPVVIGAGEAAAATGLSALWSRSGLSEPETVTLSGEVADDRARIAAAMARTALDAHRGACGEAVALDRQLAALREQLEDTRNKWQECSTALKAVTRDLPVLGFSTQSFKGTLAAGPEMVISQLLPFASLHCKAASIHIARPASAEGQLECHLMAQEDDVTLATWEGVDATAEGWRIFDMPAEIPWRYRGLRLVFTWTGPAEGAPELSLAPAAGMDRYFVHANAAPQPGVRLAMRAWTGHPTAPESGFEARQGTARKRELSQQSVKLGRNAFEAHRKLVARSLGEWPWVTSDDTGILVHPTLKGPSIVALDVDLPYAVTGFVLTLESPNVAAPEIEFLVAVFRDDVELDLDSGLQNPLPLDLAVAESGWQPVLPGSAMPVEVKLAAGRIGPLQLVLATRVKGSSIAYAHAWFRDVRAEIRV